MKQQESLLVGWCDNGSTESLFTVSLASFMVNVQALNLSAFGMAQVIGNQIARQRGEVMADFEKSGFDWLLWVDSDIVFSVDQVKMLWDAKDAETRPLISGVYFVSMEPQQSLMRPNPCIYMDDGVGLTPVHPLPHDQVLPIDAAGLGFTLMHKSVAQKLRAEYGGATFGIKVDGAHESEDISFFRKCRSLGIQPYAHTGALVPHIKRFALDINYYNLWWTVVAPKLEEQKGANEIPRS